MPDSAPVFDALFGCSVPQAADADAAVNIVEILQDVVSLASIIARLVSKVSPPARIITEHLIEDDLSAVVYSLGEQGVAAANVAKEQEIDGSSQTENKGFLDAYCAEK